MSESVSASTEREMGAADSIHPTVWSLVYIFRELIEPAAAAAAPRPLCGYGCAQWCAPCVPVWAYVTEFSSERGFWLLSRSSRAMPMYRCTYFVVLVVVAVCRCRFFFFSLYSFFFFSSLAYIHYIVFFSVRASLCVSECICARHIRRCCCEFSFAIEFISFSKI